MTAATSIRQARRLMYRQQIIAAAELEFARTGFDKTRVGDIARAAGVSVDTVYKNFDGKTDIWNALNRHRMDELIAAGERASGGLTSPLDRLLCSARAQVMFFNDHPHFLKLHVREGWNWATAGFERGRGVQADVWRTGLAVVGALTREAIAAGEISAMPPNVAAGLAVSALQVWLSEWVNTERTRSARVVADELVGHLRQMLAAPGVQSSRVEAAGPSLAPQ